MRQAGDLRDKNPQRLIELSGMLPRVPLVTNKL